MCGQATNIREDQPAVGGQRSGSRGRLFLSLIHIGAKIAAAVPDGPVATTGAGTVRGFIDKEIHVFKGIFYGADTAPRRFMAPIPPQP
jgi:hypothetical protein